MDIEKQIEEMEKYLGKDLDELTKSIIKGVCKYYSETIEITKKLRIPKGKYCTDCRFKQFRKTNVDCWCGGYYYCVLYGNTLDIEETAMSIIGKYNYNKCKQCLEDTNNAEKE